MLILIALALFIVFAFAWLTRPSGRTAVEAPPRLRRLAPLIGLLAPIVLFLSVARILLPIAPPEIVVLRSYAIGHGSSPGTDSCLQEISKSQPNVTANEPACLADFLPQGTGSSSDRNYLKEARTKLRSAPDFLERRDVLRWSESFDEKLKAAVKEVTGESCEEPSQNTRPCALYKALALQERWWAQTVGTRMVDAGPVVRRALKIFDWGHFTDEDYLNADNDLVAALQFAVAMAVAEVPPARLKPGELPPPVERTARFRPRIVEAIEASVLRLLVAGRNVKGAIVEFHARDEEGPRNSTWRSLARTLATGADTATSDPVGLVLVPGSTRSPGRLVQFMGEPFRRITDSVTKKLRVEATIRLGQAPDDGWELALREAEGLDSPAVQFSCRGVLHPGPVSLRACLYSPDLVSAGQSVALSLDVTAKATDAPLFLSINFTNEPGLAPLTRKVTREGQEPESVPITVSASVASGPLKGTLECLLDSGNAISGYPTIKRFRGLLTAAGKSNLVVGEGGAHLRPHTWPDGTRGIWIYPAGTNEDEMWDRISNELIESIDHERAFDVGNVLGNEQQLFGASLFPFAVAAPGPLAAHGASAPIPLRPLRTAPLLAGEDPSTNLKAPSAIRVSLPFAEPVVSSHVPRLHAPASNALVPIASGTLGWRIALPDSPTGERGGIIWYFALSLKQQGLLLDTNCVPQNQADHGFFCSASPDVQVYEPEYEESRFFPIWLWLMRAARETAVQYLSETGASAGARVVNAPDFVTPDMLSHARAAVAFPGLLNLGVGLCGYAAFLLLLRARQGRVVSPNIGRRRQ